LSPRRVHPILIIAMVLSLLPSPSTNGSNPDMADTTVDSDIIADTTWSPGSSPYIISGMIEVVQGATLTVLGGTTLLFSGPSGLTVKGGIIIGEEGERVTISREGSTGSYVGMVLLNASKAVLEGADIGNAIIAMDVNGTAQVHVRNSTFMGNTWDMYVKNISTVNLINSTVDFTKVAVQDDASMIHTSVLTNGTVYDFKGSPASDVKVEVRDMDGSLRLVYITNETGEIPHTLLSGRTLFRSGWDDSNGTYVFSLSDDPFTHFANTSVIVNGTGPQHLDVRWFWAPHISGLPPNITVDEDRIKFLDVILMDRNGAGSVSVSFDSEHVTYNESLGQFGFVYTDESILREMVHITAFDGYDRSEYDLEVIIATRDDPPTIDLPISSSPYVRTHRSPFRWP